MFSLCVKSLDCERDICYSDLFLGIVRDLWRVKACDPKWQKCPATWRTLRDWLISAIIYLSITIGTITIIGVGRPWARSATTSAAPTAAAAAAAVAPEVANVYFVTAAVNVCAGSTDLLELTGTWNDCGNERPGPRSGSVAACKDRRNALWAQKTSRVSPAVVFHPRPTRPAPRTLTAAATAILSDLLRQKLCAGRSRVSRSPRPSGTRRRSTSRRAPRKSCAARYPICMSADCPVCRLRGSPETYQVFNSRWWRLAPVRIWSSSIDRSRRIGKTTGPRHSAREESRRRRLIYAIDCRDRLDRLFAITYLFVAYFVDSFYEFSYATRGTLPELSRLFSNSSFAIND